MTNFAVIKKNKNVVENIISADTLEIAEAITGQECIEYTDTVGIGYIWNGTTFSAPIVE
jgi:hypothetical protein